MPFSTIREIVEKHKALAKGGKSLYENRGLGAMTYAQRNRLLTEGKIIEEDGIDVIATVPVGIVEYSPRGSEVIKRFTFKGGKRDWLQFQVGEAEAQVKTSKDKLLSSGIFDFPIWDGIIPTI